MGPMTQPLTEQFDPSKHVPVKAESPDEDAEAAHDRPDIPPASAYAKSAVVTNIRTKQKAVVHRVDLITRQLRLWYPDRKHLPLKEQFDGRTEWQSFDNWVPEIQFSPEEIARQEAKVQFAAELEEFDQDGLQLVTVFCDDPDPVKALAKLRALKKSGLVKVANAMSAVVSEANASLKAPEEPTPPPKGKK